MTQIIIKLIAKESTVNLLVLFCKRQWDITNQNILTKVSIS